MVDRRQEAEPRISGVGFGLFGGHRIADDPVGLLVVVVGSNVGRGPKNLGDRAIDGLLVEREADGIVRGREMDFDRRIFIRIRVRRNRSRPPKNGTAAVGNRACRGRGRGQWS